MMVIAGVVLVVAVAWYMYSKSKKDATDSDPVTTSGPTTSVPPKPVANAAECHGYDCTIEGQKCLPPAPGAGTKTWTCINKKWVAQ